MKWNYIAWQPALADQSTTVLSRFWISVHERSTKVCRVHHDVRRSWCYPGICFVSLEGDEATGLWSWAYLGTTPCAISFPSVFLRRLLLATRHETINMNSKPITTPTTIHNVLVRSSSGCAKGITYCGSLVTADSSNNTTVNLVD